MSYEGLDPSLRGDEAVLLTRQLNTNYKSPLPRSRFIKVPLFFVNAALPAGTGACERGTSEGLTTMRPDFVVRDNLAGERVFQRTVNRDLIR